MTWSIGHRSILGHFLPFTPLKTPKIKILKNEEDLLEMSFHTCAPKITIIWSTVPEIQTKIFVILDHFLPFYLPPLMIPNIKIFLKMKKMAGDIYLYIYVRTINEDHMIYGYWNIRFDRQKFSTFWAIFCPFSPLTTWEIKILTLKKTTGDIITLHIYIINYNHMMYGSWDKEHGRHNFLSFWTVFSPFIPLWTQKIKIKKKMEKTPKISSFYKHKWQSYDVWFLRYGVQWAEFFVILDYFLPFYPPNNPKNQNFENMKKLPGDIILLHMRNIDDNHMMYGSWDMECDGQNFLSFWTIFCPFTP